MHNERSRSRFYFIFPHIRTPLRFGSVLHGAPTPSPDRFGGLCSHQGHAAAISRRDVLSRTDTLSLARSALHEITIMPRDWRWMQQKGICGLCDLHERYRGSNYMNWRVVFHKKKIMIGRTSVIISQMFADDPSYVEQVVHNSKSTARWYINYYVIEYASI